MVWLACPCSVLDHAIIGDASSKARGDAMSRKYFGIESLNLTTAQRNTLVDALRQMGANNQHPNPAYRNHWRVRLDNLAVIFEADWNVEDWTVEQVKQRLATIFGVSVSLVTHSVAQTVYGPVVTFTRTTDRLRVVVFGGVDATYKESQAAALAYLAANAEAWGETLS